MGGVIRGRWVRAPDGLRGFGGGPPTAGGEARQFWSLEHPRGPQKRRNNSQFTCYLMQLLQIKLHGYHS